MPLYDDEGNKYEGVDEIKEYINLYNFDGAIPEYEHSRKKERREVLNFVFSMKEHHTTPKYKFDEKEKDSFFVKYKSKNGDIIDIWSEDLQRVVKDNDIKVGEYVRFKIVDKTQVEIKAKRLNKKTNKWTVYTKTALKNVWDCSVQGRLEKDLKTVTKSKDTKIKYG